MQRFSLLARTRTEALKSRFFHRELFRRLSFSAHEINIKKENWLNKTLEAPVKKIKFIRKTPKCPPNFYVTAVDSRANIIELARFMVERNAGSCFVVNKDYMIQGFLTLTELIFQIEPTKESPVNVTSIMTDVKDVLLLDQTTTVMKALEAMISNHVKHLPILAKKEIDRQSDLHINVIDHVISNKRLLWECYTSLMSTVSEPEDSSPSMEQEVFLADFETKLSDALSLPTLIQVLSGKKDVILNTEISDGITVREGLEAMKLHGMSYIAFFDGMKFNGIMTEKHFLRYVVSTGTNADSMKLSEIQRSSKDQRNHVSAETSILTCMRLLAVNNHRHLIVVNKDEFIGVITASDIAATLISYSETKD